MFDPSSDISDGKYPEISILEVHVIPWKDDILQGRYTFHLEMYYGDEVVQPLQVDNQAMFSPLLGDSKLLRTADLGGPLPSETAPFSIRKPRKTMQWTGVSSDFL